MSAEARVQVKPASPPPSVTHVSSGLLQRKCACGGSPGAGGECAECQKKRLGLQRKEAGGGGPVTAPPIVHEVLSSPGRSLEPDTRGFMESRFGHDFGRVRVHTNARAAQSAGAVGALAYTVGTHVVFASGQYDPQTQVGQRLLSHELAHVVQQHPAGDGGAMGSIPISRPNDASEIEAEEAATRVTGGGGVALRRSCGPTLQRVIPTPQRKDRDKEEDETTREAEELLDKARKLLEDAELDPEKREQLKASIQKVENALKRYQGGAGAAVGPVAGGTFARPMPPAAAGSNPVAGVAGLLLLLLWLLYRGSVVDQKTEDGLKELRDSLDDLRPKTRPKSPKTDGTTDILPPLDPSYEGPCCCCAESLEIQQPEKIDDERMGHRFLTLMDLGYTGTGRNGKRGKRSCRLDWLEWTTHPYHPKMKVREWNDMLDILPSSFGTWFSRKEECPGNHPVIDEDKPGIAKSVGSQSRILRFHITLHSGEGCPCQHPRLELKAEQFLVLRNGQPEWLYTREPKPARVP